MIALLQFLACLHLFERQIVKGNTILEIIDELGSFLGVEKIFFRVLSLFKRCHLLGHYLLIHCMFACSTISRKCDFET